MKNLFAFTFYLVLTCNSFAQINIVHPPNWWIGFENTDLQLLVKKENISNYDVFIDYPGVTIKSIQKADSPNYIFINLDISPNTKEGNFKIIFKNDNEGLSYMYNLKNKRGFQYQNEGFDSSDVIYLITPDRFVNGNEKNDIIRNMRENSIDRSDGYARHGGDIKGISENLDYIDNMGFTSLWLNPVLINDMKDGSYHGYATTDYYTVDPRFGTFKEYLELSEKAVEKNIKLIKDIIVNHCGLYHWWMDDLPFNDWLNFQENYINSTEKDLEKNTVYSNHRRSTIQDIYASKIDYRGMVDGWFVSTMPDLII